MIKKVKKMRLCDVKCNKQAIATGNTPNFPVSLSAIMNLRFVEAFFWVASLKSIVRPSEKLSLAQSAMSSRISTLEDELDVLLLDRGE